MTLFQPVDVMGPAHRAPQLAALAQHAAANVMRRNRMKALLAQGARGARSAGAGQPFRNSLNMRPLGNRGATLKGLAGLITGGSNVLGGGNGRLRQDDGVFGAGGGGYDYPSIPDPTDPRQSPVGAGPATAWPGPTPHGGVGTADMPASGPDFNGPGGSVQGGSLFGPDQGSQLGAAAGVDYSTPDTPEGWAAVAPQPSSGGGVNNDPTGSGLIHLGNGMYYDPATDSVRGGARR